MIRGSGRVRLFAVLVALGALSAGCSAADGLVFRQDRRVALESPEYREVVDLPVTLDWTVDDGLAAALADPSAPPEGFAVLIDVDPQPPGEPLRYFARDDDTCRADDGCPDLGYLAARGIHVTRDTSFTIERLLPAPGVDVDRGDRDIHEVTLVLLDADGIRLGESAWTFTFEVRQDDG